MAKKTKLSKEKPSKPTKRKPKHAKAHEPKAAEKLKPVKFVKAVTRQAIQPKSKAYEVACEAVGQMFPSAAVEALAADNKGVPKQSKQNLLIALLRHPEGATLSQIMKSTGWQAHTARGVISGVLRKKLGLTVIRENNEDKASVYKIIEVA